MRAQRLLLLKNSVLRCFSKQIRYNSSVTPFSPGKTVTKSYEEITIDVPWGHIAGKWYGPKHVRPVVGLHGWQDNAGTFDRLAPLLPGHLSFLSLDMPGHGLSSWLPEGMSYHSIDYVGLIHRLMEDFHWPKISLMGHSMSSINCFVFSALFPEKVDLLIGLDVLKPLIRTPPKIVDGYRQRLEHFIVIDKRMKEKSEPPSYEWEHLIERLHIGTDKSVDQDVCVHLLNRNIKPSQDNPNRFYFSRDNRLKCSLFYSFSQEVALEMASRIKCPHLFIKATQAPYYERREFFDEAIKVLCKNPLFEFHQVNGTHHVHLNEPEKVVPYINPFLMKYRP